MSRYVLDSDILSLLQHNHAAVRANYLAHTADELCVAVVTVDEQLRGWYTVVRNAKKRDELALAYANLAKSISFLSKATILPFTESSIDRFDQLKRLKLGIGSPDLRFGGDRAGASACRGHAEYARFRRDSGAERRRLVAAVTTASALGLPCLPAHRSLPA